jgi:hypothetical protein
VCNKEFPARHEDALPSPVANDASGHGRGQDVAWRECASGHKAVRRERANAKKAANGDLGVETDRIVSFWYPFSHFWMKCGCEYGYCQIRLQSGCYSNTYTDGLFSQFGAATNNKILYWDIIIKIGYRNFIRIQIFLFSYPYILENAIPHLYLYLQRILIFTASIFMKSRFGHYHDHFRFFEYKYRIIWIICYQFPLEVGPSSNLADGGDDNVLL